MIIIIIIKMSSDTKPSVKSLSELSEYNIVPVCISKFEFGSVVFMEILDECQQMQVYDFDARVLLLDAYKEDKLFSLCLEKDGEMISDYNNIPYKMFSHTMRCFWVIKTIETLNDIPHDLFKSKLDENIKKRFDEYIPTKIDLSHDRVYNKLYDKKEHLKEYNKTKRIFQRIHCEEFEKLEYNTVNTIKTIWVYGEDEREDIKLEMEIINIIKSFTNIN